MTSQSRTIQRRDVLMGAAAAAAGTAFVPKTIYAQTASKKLSFLTWNLIDQKEVFEGWFEGFKRLKPGTEIEWLDKKGPELPAFYQTQLAAGTPPDVIDIQGALGLEYAGQGALLDISELLKKDADVARRFNADYLSSWVLDGKSYMVPFFIAKTVLFYNKRMMSEAGLAAPPTSFDEILSHAAKMSSGDKTGFMTLNFDWLYWPLYRMNGVDLLSADLKKAAFNTPEAEKVTAALTKATEAGHINKISWTGRWVEPNGAFAAGNVGMLHAHAPAYFFFKGQGAWVNESTVGVTHAPGNWSTPNNHGVGISKGSKNPELAWDFIKYITDKPQFMKFAVARKLMLGHVEADKEHLELLAKQSPFEATIMRTQIEHTDKMTGNWRIPNDSAVKNAIWPEMQSAFLGRKDAKSALAEAERKIARELRRG